MPKIVSHFVRGERVIELGNLDVERDFSDVRDVARIYRQLLEVNSAGQTVNVCSARGYALRQIIAAMQEIAGYEIEVRVNQNFVRVSEVKTLVGSSLRLQSLIGGACGDSLAANLAMDQQVKLSVFNVSGNLLWERVIKARELMFPK